MRGRASARTTLLEVARLELAQQGREPLTWLYALVFAALTAGFVAGGTVELVDPAVRGDRPREAPLALALAMAGLTAFGQVITTMVMATALLRDRAQRSHELIATTGAPWAALLLGRAAAAWLVLVVVTLGMPLGAWAASVIGGGAALPTALAVGWAWGTGVVPTMTGVAALHLAAGALGRTLWHVLGASLALLGAWQALLTPGAARLLGSWAPRLDPFGTAPLVALARDPATDWMALPWSPLLAANRVGLLAVAALLTAITLWRATPALLLPSGGTERRRRPALGAMGRTPPLAIPVRSPAARALGVVRAQAGHTLRETLAERAFVVIAALGALNVAANVAGHGATALADALPVAREHGRLFLILLATIYAGELCWRERELRAAPLIDTTPAPTWALVLGRVGGIAVAEGLVVLALIAGAVAAWGMAGGTAAAGDGAMAGAFAVTALWLPFVQWTALSLAVHAVVRHKVGGHLLLISAWMVAVALDARGFDAPWYRVADVPPVAWARWPDAAARLAWGALHWSVVAAWGLTVAVLAWPRAHTPTATRIARTLLVVLAGLAVLTGRALQRHGAPTLPVEDRRPVAAVAGLSARR